MRLKVKQFFGQKEVKLGETDKIVTPFGGLFLLVEFFNRIVLRQKLLECLPFSYTSANHICPIETMMSFVLNVLCGAKRFSHCLWLKGDDALRLLFGIKRFAIDDTIRNFWQRFTQGHVVRFFDPLWQWQLSRLKITRDYLDMDSTVIERYGNQEGSVKGYNPKKRGRPSHHPLLAFLSKSHFALHGWLRPGNCTSKTGVVEFLKEALAKIENKIKVICVRADAGFFDDELFNYLEEPLVNQDYIVVAKMTPWVKRQLLGITNWQALDEKYEIGCFHLKLMGWEKQRRFVAVREIIQDGKRSLGKLLLDVPGYTYRAFVTNKESPAIEIWREYNLRADIENRILELKHDLGLDAFCMKQFFATEAIMMCILMISNLMIEFQKTIKNENHQRPSTLKSGIFVCGAIMGTAQNKLTLFLSKSWGGLEKRKSMFENILNDKSLHFAEVGFRSNLIYHF